MFNCEAVELDFIERAPIQFTNIIELNATPEAVFEVLADIDSWPKWFGGMSSTSWLTPAPYGTGAQRQVTLFGLVKVTETFLAWQPGQRFCFRFEQQNALLAKAAIEDIQLEALANNRCQLTYNVYLELPKPMSALSFAFKPILGMTFKRGAKGLAKHINA